MKSEHRKEAVEEEGKVQKPYRRSAQGWKCTSKSRNSEEEREMGKDKEWRKKNPRKMTGGGESSRG